MESKFIAFSRGGGTLVDADLAETFAGRAIWQNGRGYAEFSQGGRPVRLHRHIAKPPDGMDVDHINGDKLDNRRSNLRVVTRGANTQNSHAPCKNKSAYRRVHRLARRQTWVLTMRLEPYGPAYRGVCRSRHVGAMLVDDLASGVIGPFAARNFPGMIPRRCLPGFLEGTAGKIFRVVFSKRSDGRQREMTCRIGVSIDLNGKGMSFEPSDKDLFVVYDVHKRAYRSIPLERVLCLRFAGVNYRLVEKGDLSWPTAA